ncbi:MAG: hypothetical protein JXK07_14410 [Spirochaetes bacterium]|nr:hypothetical protein [Spirochaetota bacterium]MBN2770187.1 hypothetical protein [Spirochaetota bacterium]
MIYRIGCLMLLALLASCCNNDDLPPGHPEVVWKEFILTVTNNSVDSVDMSIKNLEYLRSYEDDPEKVVRFGQADWEIDEAVIDSGGSNQLTIEYFFGWGPYGIYKTMWDKTNRLSSFMFEFEFESGKKISYWGLPQECDVIGYGADYYGIAWVSKDTDGLYTVYDEDNRFANFALKAVINSPDDIEISVDYENSVIFEITD